MAITIRNKKTEDLIRQIGRRTGEGPSAVILRLVERENAGAAEPSKDEVEQRLKVFSDLRRDFPPPEPKPTWAEMEHEMESVFDYLGEEPQMVRRIDDK